VLVDITEMNYIQFNRYNTRTLTWDAKKIGDWRFIQAWN